MPDEFLERVDNWLATERRRGAIAYIEIQDPYAHACSGSDLAPSAGSDVVDPEILGRIGRVIGPLDIFCWFGGRFILLMSQSSAAAAHQTLRRVGREIAFTQSGDDMSTHVTPAIGYVDVRMASTPRALWQMADAALESAKSSLDIEPFRYVRGSLAGDRVSRLPDLSRLWSKAPQWLALSVQLVLSFVLGLGGPFILYAVCDALGADISGPVYIGVVIVLVITATTIWIEGFLALRPTEPPEQPGSPHPVATVIIPAYLPNEAETIVETLDAFLRLDYPNTVQIIIAYNSPFAWMPIEDELEAIAAREAPAGRFIIEPVRVAGSTSKAQNVNAVVGRVRGRFVGIYDADHHPQPDSLSRAWRWLSNGWDIVQGRCSIRNGGDSWVSRMIAVEFEQIYAVSHPGRARFHGFGIFGGSNGFWRTTVLHETRMRHSMLTEDIDSSIRAVAAGYRITGDRDLISEELAPTALSQLLNQRLRWAQGWFQVSLRRVVPVLRSPHVTLRQKLGLIHLLVWRELFPWYSIQVVPILCYWVWVYGWSYIHWAVPIFLFTTIYTFLTGPTQILFAYLLATKSMRQRRRWFIEYLLVGTLFFSPFKDTLSRIAHLKEAMRERAWRVTPRAVPARGSAPQLAKAALVAFLVAGIATGSDVAKAADTSSGTTIFGLPRGRIATLLGGEASTINSARTAAREGRNAEAATLFAHAIQAVPTRRAELLREYADALSYSGRSREAVPLYRELMGRSGVSPVERVELLRHLALALTWSGQQRAALAVYDDALGRAPGDADLAIHRARVLTSLGRPADALAALDRVAPDKWSAGPLGSLADEIMVDAARHAAKSGQNDAGARYFERAIKHNNGMRTALLREYADQLVFSKRVAAAIPLYREIVDRRDMPLASRIDAEFGLAKALQQSGAPVDAYRLYTLALSHGSAIDMSQPLATRLAKASTSADVQQILRSRGIATDRLMTGARMAAAAERAGDSASLAKKAMAECVRCTGDLPRQHADQLASSRQMALVHQALALSALHQSQAALTAYKAAYEIDRENVDARRGIVDETVNMARAAAQEDRNADAAALFASAIQLDGRKRTDLLREYADQLSFAGHSADAIPLYQEVLGNESLSALDRRRAVMGLAAAYASSGNPSAALASYDQFIAAYPDDVDLQRGRLLLAARLAARADKNAEAADLFAQAIKLSPAQSGEILREYADQLSFTNRASSAVTIYQQVLARSDLTLSDSVAAEKGLARAYDWSGRYSEAKAAYAALSTKYPDDTSLQRDLLVASAREAAQSDQNRLAASLFAQAIKLDMAHSGDILREFADQLSFTGRSANAIILYRMVLDQSKLVEADRWAAKKGLARAYDWSGRFSEAKATYAELSAKYPDDLMMRWNLLVVSGREAGKVDRNKEAAGLFADAMRLVPARRLLILKEYADKLTYSGNAKAAIPLYRELLAQDRTADAVRSHELALALALVWDKQPKAALKEYRRLAAADPSDLEAANGEARMLSWTGRQSDAKAVYQAILARSPGNASAKRGLAQAEDWQGHHRSAQSILAERIAEEPRDLEARRLLAQSEVWSGRPDKALDEVSRALQRKAPSPAPSPTSEHPVRATPLTTSDGITERTAGLQTAS